MARDVRRSTTGVVDAIALVQRLEATALRPVEVLPDGGEAEAGMDHQLDAYTHLYFLNRGILITPFHNMLLVSPQTSAGDVDRFNEVFRSLIQDLL